ncbi:hypothetical protein BaRGS_00036115, partial [Batillaria attramentaria]
ADIPLSNRFGGLALPDAEMDVDPSASMLPESGARPSDSPTPGCSSYPTKFGRMAIWSLRERLAEALLHDGYCYKYDVSLPLSALYQLVVDMRQRLEGAATHVVGYGHVGDGNLHLNVTSPEYSQRTMDLIEPFIYDWVSKQKGSISAEHGLGFKKRDFIYHSKSTSAITLMKQIKNLVDPKGIMNPYKLLPSK